MAEQLTFQTMGGETVTVKQRGKHYVQPRGYFYPPGTGPASETCGSCRFSVRRGRSKKRYIKCEKNRAKWTHGRGSDILSRSAACKYWEAQPE